MFDEILSYTNFEAAYLEIIEEFALDRRNFHYHGLDNLFLRDLDLKSKKIIIIAQRELRKKQKIEPALSIQIPKKNKPGEFREIFIYNLKERIKAQAIYRVLLPEFEKIFSPRLFSYRPNKPPHIAARLFCQRYRRQFSVEQALVIDLKNYSDRINREIMFNQLQQLFPDQKILDLLRLFIFNRVYREGKCETPIQGLIQGVPLIALFANLYLTDLDFKYQKQATFYVRVGDDLAFLDADQSKLTAILENLSVDLQARGLLLNQRKLFLGQAQEQFSFLGYAFKQGAISLETAFVTRTIEEWKNILVYKHRPYYYKIKLLKRILLKPDRNFNTQFLKIIHDKPQINNSQQIQKLSETFYAILTKFFYEHYSPRNRRLLTTALTDIEITSLYSYYKKFHYARH
jgi:hypothetical protein